MENINVNNGLKNIPLLACLTCNQTTHSSPHQTPPPGLSHLPLSLVRYRLYDVEAHKRYTLLIPLKYPY